MCSYVDQLKEYQSFEDVSQLKEAFNLFRKVFRHELTKADNEILFTLTGYAAKFPGACKLKLETIAEKTGYSLSTVKRTIQKSDKLGILKRINNRKENGRRKGANVYQFQKFVSELYNEPKTMDQRQNDEKPCESKNEAAKNEAEAPSSLSPSFSFKDTNITEKRAENNSVDKELFKKQALLDKLPNALRGLSVYFDESQKIYDLAGVIFDAKSKVSKKIKIEEHDGLFRNVVASVFEYWKRQVEKGITDYNVFGLMFVAVEKLCKKIVDGTAYEVKKNVYKAPKRKFSNVPEYLGIDMSIHTKDNTPEWFADRNEEVKPATTNENIDFAAAQAEFQARLAALSK